MRVGLKVYFNFKRGISFLMFPLVGLLFLVFQNASLYCQNAGYKYFTNYSSKDYDLQPQNWCILQDRQGIIYVGNQGGLLEYDGVSWRNIKIPNRPVRSLAIDDTATIYVGGNNEIGLLALDSNGTRQYVSLLGHLKEKQKNFSNVWRTHSTKEGIYFRTSRFLFRWRSGQLDTWGPDRFNASFIYKGKLYIRREKHGLMEMVDASFRLVPGGSAFAGKKIYVLLPYDTGRMLIGTRVNGLYIYDGARAMPFLTEADDYLKENQLYHGIRLLSPPGDFALATLRGGLVIINSHGELKRIFNEESGLQDDNVKYVFEDFHGNVWLALENGISKIEYNSPISIYDNRSNLKGLVLSVTRHGAGNDLYVGTTRGLYALGSPSAGGFRLVPGTSGECRFILSIGDSLLAAASDGVFQVENNKGQRVLKTSSYTLLHSISVSNRVWVGTRGGLSSLYLKNGQWEEEHKFKNITEEIRTIVEDQKGNLWLGTRTRGVLEVKPRISANGSMKPALVNRYYKSHGLPDGEIHVFTAAGHVMFATRKGLFRFEKNKGFIPDFTLGEEFADGSRSVFRVAEDNNNHIWFHSKFQNFQAIPRPDGFFSINAKPFLRVPRSQVNIIYPDPDGKVIWFGSHDGLIRYDKTVEKNYHHDFPTLIRDIVVNGKFPFSPGSLLPVFKYRDRNLTFKCAAPYYEAESSMQYRYFLEGYNDDWSAWGPEPQKDYTNLDSGLYNFRVQAKNVYGVVGREAAFQFRILPPWYKTWWAFSIDALIFFLLVLLIVRWRSRKLELEKQSLEQVVKKRTKEIEEKNRQLEEQSEKLKEMDKVKSRFFANISHEFRTPLTLIMGPLEQMVPTCQEKVQKKKLELMLRNSQRLLSLINQLLELSKFESGKMKLQASRQNIVVFLKGVLASFESVAAQNKLDLTFHAEEEEITLYFDLEKLEGIIGNLLANAVKFTPPGGEVTVTVKPIHPEKQSLEISVSDTGVGIPRQQLTRIFDRFYQVEGFREHDHKGSGIGLALVKELVSLHHGKIDVHSREGKGTEFIIRLPMGDAHLTPKEMVEQPEEPYQHKYLKEIPSFYVLEKEEEEAETPETIEVDTGKPGKDIILVVEDNADVRDYIRGALEPDYKVMEAKDGKGGIEKAKEIIPDLIITDVMMPGMDGYELCRMLKNEINTSHVPIILLTAKASEESIVEGLESGADDYITKPFNTKILCARIKNLIDLRRQLQEKLKREMTLQPAKIAVSNIDKEFLKEVQVVIEKNLADPDFNVEELGRKLYMSRATVYRKIHALSGESPTEFIRSYRLKRAAELLKKNFGTVLEVAVEVGFSSAAYFTKCFKEEFHQLPSTYLAS